MPLRSLRSPALFQEQGPSAVCAAIHHSATSDGSGGTDVTNLTDELAEEKARYAVLAAAARRSRRSHLVRGQPPRGTLTRKCRQANIEPADQRRSLRLGASHGLRSWFAVDVFENSLFVCGID
jgi:hypothetical protein